MAGTPEASLMIAVFAISEIDFAGMSASAGYQRRTTVAAIRSPKNNGTNTGGTSHSRKSKLWVSGMFTAVLG